MQTRLFVLHFLIAAARWRLNDSVGFFAFAGLCCKALRLKSNPAAVKISLGLLNVEATSRCRHKIFVVKDFLHHGESGIFTMVL